MANSQRKMEETHKGPRPKGSLIRTRNLLVWTSSSRSTCFWKITTLQGDSSWPRRRAIKAKMHGYRVVSACPVLTAKPQGEAVLMTCHPLWFELSGMASDLKYTASLCKSHLAKQQSDWVLHQITGLPQSPNLNPAELIRDELDHRVKEKQPTSPRHTWEPLRVCRKNFRWRSQECAKLLSKHKVPKDHIWAGDCRVDLHSSQYVQLLDLFKCPQVRYCSQPLPPLKSVRLTALIKLPKCRCKWGWSQLTHYSVHLWHL